jgi:hypothetical protein
MSDYFFTKYYNDIKDPLWPQIKTYNDFLKLPKQIQEECINQHKLNDRLAEIEDKNYWGNIGFASPCAQDNNLVYMLVQKCGSTYYKKIFSKNRWNIKRSCDVDWKNTAQFGLISHPLTRFVRGFVESLQYLYPNTDNDKCYDQLLANEFNKKNIINFISTIKLTDEHTMPYHLIFKDKLYNIDWIPYESGTPEELTQLINKFLLHYGHEPIVATDDYLHIANTSKQKLYNLIERIFFSDDFEPVHEGFREQLYYFYAEDLKFYHQLIRKFNPNGSTWDEISWLREK